MKTVLVTGASGRVGSEVAAHFLAEGWQVRGLDKQGAPQALRGKIEWVYGDITNRFDLLRATQGVDAVAHLAAIPAPVWGEVDIMTVNVVGTQWLLDACEQNGVNRVALASTGCTFGIIFARHPFKPQYLPMDEAHPALPQDMYGLSKVCNELTAAAYTRRCGMTTTALRLTTVMHFEERTHDHWIRRSLDSEDFRTDLWTYVDVRDVALAFRLAIERQEQGTHTTALLCARDSFCRRDIREQVKTHLPQFAEQVAHLAPDGCLYDLSAAEAAFGFVAPRSWRDIPELRNP
jgi:nucleoside-diphosphate-sugar epimerase